MRSRILLNEVEQHRDELFTQFLGLFASGYGIGLSAFLLIG